MAEWRLEITTWRGLSFGAEHWYGRLYEPDDKWQMEDGHILMGGNRGWPEQYDVMHILSHEEAEALNGKQDTDLWQAGDTSAGHPTREEVIENAVVLFLEVSEAGDILTSGNDAYGNALTIATNPAILHPTSTKE